MTEEQYKRAVEINNRLNNLSKVIDEIKGTSTHKLSYMYKSSYDSDYKPVSDWVMNHIANILDKHDNMIRTEIDEEIDKLKKEIEAL